MNTLSGLCEVCAH